MVCESGYALHSVRVLTSSYERPHLLPTPPACVVELIRMRVPGSRAMLLDCRADAGGGKRVARMSSTVQMRTWKMVLTPAAASVRTYDEQVEQQKARTRQLDEGDECGEGRDDIWPGASDTSLSGKLVESADWRSSCDLICQRNSPGRPPQASPLPALILLSIVMLCLPRASVPPPRSARLCVAL